MNKALFLVFCFFTSIFLSLPVLAGDRPTVFVSILPQKYFVQKICGDRLDVEVMVQPGASPHTYEPKASQMARLAGAAAYFAVGVPFEDAWLKKLAAVSPQMRIVHTEAGIAKLPIAAHHDGEGEAHHTEEGIPDPHIWLSPPLVKTQVATITDALVDLFPEEASLFRGNRDAFLQEIDRLDTRLHQILADSRGGQFMVYHPTWGYFAREYGLRQVPVEIEGKQPKPAQLQDLVKHARALAIRVIFVQPQFSRKSAEIIAREIGGEVVPADPLAEDWAHNLVNVAENMAEAEKK